VAAERAPENASWRVYWPGAQQRRQTRGPYALSVADGDVPLAVLPSTDLYLMGRHQDHKVLLGVVAAHELLYDDVNCSLSTNNVLNPSF
jgi:hypothetical protein